MLPYLKSWVWAWSHNMQKVTSVQPCVFWNTKQNTINFKPVNCNAKKKKNLPSGCDYLFNLMMSPCEPLKHYQWAGCAFSNDYCGVEKDSIMFLQFVHHFCLIIVLKINDSYWVQKFDWTKYKYRQQFRLFLLNRKMSLANKWIPI